jgi:hypothetical protein
MSEGLPATYCISCEYDAGSTRAECCPECGGELSPIPTPTPPTDKYAIIALGYACLMLPMTCVGALLMLPPTHFGRVSRLNVASSVVFLLLTCIGFIRCWRVARRLQSSQPRNPGFGLAQAGLTLLGLEIFITLAGTFAIITY